VAKRKPEPKPEPKPKGEAVEEYGSKVEVKLENIIVDYSPTQRRNLKEVVGKNIIIYSVDFRSGKRGMFAVIDALVEDSGEEAQFYTFSKPVVEELEGLAFIFEDGKRLRVRICMNEKKGYLYLCEPTKKGG
jgi:hypothetical protein